MFIDEIEKRGLKDRLSLLVTADHGEGFFDRGDWEHALDPYEEQIRIPLVISSPLVSARGRLDAPASLMDIMPTVLDLAGVPAPYPLDGRSLRPRLTQPTSGP